MESLFYDFSLLSDEALRDKRFDPSTIEDLVKLFEVEAYKAWADLELQSKEEHQEGRDSVEEAEAHLDSAMESAMAEFRRFEEEMDRAAAEEHDSLVSIADGAWKLARNLEKAATLASKKYIDAAMNSATASMKSALRSITVNSKKIHPS